MGPHRTLAALFGEVWDCEDTGMLQGHLGDPSFPYPLKHCQHLWMVPACWTCPWSSAHDGCVSLNNLLRMEEQCLQNSNSNSLFFCRGCQNGSVYVWTLPQGGTTVSLPNIKSSPPSQDKCTDLKVGICCWANFFLNIYQFVIWVLSTGYFMCLLYCIIRLEMFSRMLVINFCPMLQQESAECVFVLHGHITAVRSLSFCPSGLALVSGGIGGLLNIWSLQVSKAFIM